jgi:hypothetical protein
VPIYNAIPTGGAPQINGIIPATATPGSSGYIEMYGADLDAAPVVGISGTGVTVAIVFTSAGQINLYYTVAAGAALGARTITVETNNGTSNGVSFTIVSAP